MTTLATPTPPANYFLTRTVYRDSWAHLNAHQRAELRREYKHLRRLDVGRTAAKGVIFRTVDLVQGWD